MGYTIYIGPKDAKSGDIEIDKEWTNVCSMSYSCGEDFSKQSPQHTSAWKAWRADDPNGADPVTVFLTPKMVQDILELPVAGDDCHGHTTMLKMVLRAALKLYPNRRLYLHMS